MDWQPVLQDDFNFWDEITDQLCMIIAEAPVTHASDCLDRTFAIAEREDQPLPTEPSLEQAAEEAEYAKLVELKTSADCHADVTDVKRESREDRRFDPPAEENLNFLDLDSSATQVLDAQQIAGDSKPSELTPTWMPATKRSSSRTVTPGEFPEAPMSVIRKNPNGSPTPAVATAVADHDMMSSPVSLADIEAKSPKRKLSFGMPEFGDEHEVRMPPPKLRKASPTLDDQVFWSFVNTDAVAMPIAEMIFKDIQQPSTADHSPDNDVPKTPMLVEFSIPPSPAVIIDGFEDFYSTFRDGDLTKIPMHILNSVRKILDPTSQDDRYWADGLYFCDTPAPSLFCESQESKMHSLDWRIIFHALDNDADRRIPLPDTTTRPQTSDGQLNKIWRIFRGDDTQEATVQAKLLRLWTMDQMSESGLKWTEVRGNYSREPPEYTPRTSQDICNDHYFRIFCCLANFLGGRPAIMPRGPALRNTFGVLKYARLANDRPRPYLGGLPQPQLELLPQQAVPTGLSPLFNDNIALEDNHRNHPSRPPTPAPTPASPHLIPSARLLPAQPRLIPRNNFVNRAFSDLHVFCSLPHPTLLKWQQQYMYDQAQMFLRRNLPSSRVPPTTLQLWGYFRQRISANTRAREIQVARVAQAGAEAQASMLRNQFVGLPVQGKGRAVQANVSLVPIPGRDLQLASHMPPMTPGARGVGRGNLAVTALGSPFRTPARGRSDCIDPRLLHS
jgi:hypothetical protein